MPFGYDTSTPDTGHWFLDHIAPGYTPGQRIFGGLIRAFGGPLGSIIGGRLANAWDHAHNPNASSYGGSFFSGGQMPGGSSPFDGSNYGSQYGLNSGTFNSFGTGYGSGNLFNANPYNVDAFNQPTDPTQVGPFGNTQSASGGGGAGNAAGNSAASQGGSPGGQLDKLMGGRYGWGVSTGPNYS